MRTFFLVVLAAATWIVGRGLLREKPPQSDRVTTALQTVIENPELAPLVLGDSGSTTERQAFSRFLIAFEVLNRKVARAAGGAMFFTDAKYAGDGIVTVTATDLWLSGPRSARASNLATILSLWQAAVNHDFPLFVNVHDRSGNLRMTTSNHK